MKNKWKFIIFLGLSLCFNSCNEEVDNEMIEQQLAPFSVEEAQAWYDTKGQEELNLKSGNTEDAGIRIKPDWCNANTSQNDLIEVIETDLFVQGSFGFADEVSSAKWRETKDPKMITSLSRLVTLRYKKDGRIEQFLMTIVGDKDFHDKGIGKLSDNSYLTRNKQFSGYILFHNLMGNFVNGWKYVNGTIVRKCFQGGDKSPLIHLKKADCIAVTVTLYNQFCTDWYQNGTYIYTTCENRVSEYQDYYLFCSFEPDPDGGDGGYGGGGGEIPPTTPTLNLTQQIQNSNSLNTTQKNLLENAFITLTSEGCLTNATYNTLVNKGFKINFKMDPTINSPAYYDPRTKFITFKTDNDINMGNLKEELFHAMQDAFYAGGTTQYLSTGRVNIEFEAKLYKDIMAYPCCGALNIGTAPDNIIQAYNIWVYSIQDNPSSISNSDYQYWLNQFNTYTPAYSSLISANLSSPDALKSLISICH